MGVFNRWRFERQTQHLEDELSCLSGHGQHPGALLPEAPATRRRAWKRPEGVQRVRPLLRHQLPDVVRGGSYGV